MALLGMMDLRKPSKDIEAKRRRNGESLWAKKKELGRKDSSRHLYLDKDKKDSSNHSNGGDFSSKPSAKIFKNFITKWL